MTKLLVAAAFLGLNFYTYHFLAAGELTPARQEFASFPLALDDWRCAGREAMDAAIERNLGVTDHWICQYRREQPAALVGVYVGYHASQVRRGGGGSRENAIHPPKHCLPGSGWDIIAARQEQLDLPGLPERPARVNRLVIAKGESRQLVYYWYQSRGRVIAEDWRKIVSLFWDRATRRRTDGSLVRFTVPIVRGDEAGADRWFRDFAGRFLPVLPPYVPG